MKKLAYIVFTLVAVGTGSGFAASANNQPNNVAPAVAKIRSVDFKRCIETSKLGKKEQTSFEALKKQMESSLSEKEKTLNEMAQKLEDPDYLDSLTAEAETELKRKFRALNQEYTQLQSQYLQALQQTNYKVIQKITQVVEKASNNVAQKNNYDMILNDESAFFVSSSLDVTSEVVAAMDDIFEKELATEKAAAQQTGSPSTATTPKK